MDFLGRIFSTAVSARNFLFDKNILPARSVNAWVISVGNLTVGGTGKTPVVDYLVGILKTKYKVGIVSRGYGSNLKGTHVVAPNRAEAASFYGDEPVLLATKHPDVPVVISANRYLGAKKLVDDLKVQVIIADDAFQHRWLKRDRDVVVIDATENKKNYFPLPFGRAREPFDALNRADLVLITKTNLAAPEQLRWIKGNVRFARKMIQFKAMISGYRNLYGEYRETFLGQDVILVSGIGKPENFERSISGNIKQHLKFPDHHAYSEEEREEICELSLTCPVLTTEKDAVKFQGMNSKNLWISQFRVVPELEESEFYECIHPHL